MKEIPSTHEAPETRETRVDRTSQFFEDHGLKRPDAAANETRGVGSMVMERDATAAGKRDEAAAQKADAAGNQKEAKEQRAEAENQQKEAEWSQAMGAVNFNQPVERKTLEAGTVLYRHEVVRADSGVGGPAAAGLGWFCGGDTSPRHLGMVRDGGLETGGNRFGTSPAASRSCSGRDGGLETGGNRFVLPDGTRLERKGFVATRPVEALESTASDLCSFRPEDKSGLLYFGGEKQLCVGDRSAMKPLEGLSLDEEIRLRLGGGKRTDDPQ